MTKISFVYFDVGGVAVRDYSDSNKWVEMMDFMGVAPNRREEFDILYHTYDNQICTGLDIDSLVPEFSQKLGLSLPVGFSMNRYFVDHFDAKPELLAIARQLKQKMKVGLLTDIYPHMLNLIFERQLLPQDLWNVIVDSSVEKIRKPMPAIYELATARAGVPASEILFIDNREKNLVPARALGWQTHLYDSRDYTQANGFLSDFLTLQGFSL